MELKLPNGMVLTGTVEQVSEAAKKLGYPQVFSQNEWYVSSTKGPILIREMESTHLKNALLRQYREWASSLSTLTGRQLATALANGPTDPNLMALMREYMSRASRNQV